MDNANWYRDTARDGTRAFVKGACSKAGGLAVTAVALAATKAAPAASTPSILSTIAGMGIVGGKSAGTKTAVALALPAIGTVAAVAVGVLGAIWLLSGDKK